MKQRTENFQDAILVGLRTQEVMYGVRIILVESKEDGQVYPESFSHLAKRDIDAYVQTLKQ